MSERSIACREVTMKKLILVLFLVLILGIVLAAILVPAPELPTARWTA